MKIDDTSMTYSLRTRFGIALVSSLTLALASVPAHARPSRDTETIKLTVGDSETIPIRQSIEKIVVGNPEIVDVISMPPKELLVTGKAAGETHMTVSLKDGRAPRDYLIIVGRPTEAVQQALRDVFPNDPIVVRSEGNLVYLTGMASDVATAEAAGRMVASQLGGGRSLPEIVNLIEVVGLQQVQVHLRFIEVSRTNLRNLGFQAWYQDNAAIGGVLAPGIGLDLERRDTFTSETERTLSTGEVVNRQFELPILESPLSGSFSILFANRDFPISAAIGVLKSHGFAKTLSEPTLVALNGQEANFLVGGEFPVPMPDALGRISIDFKSFGVQLQFVPIVLRDQTVQLKLDATVSDLDAAAGVTVEQVRVPGLKARQSSTTIRVKDGQSFAIAGLLSDTMRSTVNKIPLLGDLPVVGALFRTVHSQREETELVVVATVHLVQPMEEGDLPPLPGETEYNDPSDFELFLLGRGESREKRPIERRKAKPGPAGPVGFQR